MARHPRLIVPGVPLHITQRGVNRQPTFVVDEDFAYYRWALHQASADTGCRIHAYVLMSNHVHLLLTPDDAAGPARLMRQLGSRYVRTFNERYRRTGTLWEGRFRSALVDSTAYLFSCYRYIESNPVRASMVADPREYTWSSYHHNALGEPDPVIGEHAAYGAMGASREGRCAAYRQLFGPGLLAADLATIRASHVGRSATVPRGAEETAA